MDIVFVPHPALEDGPVQLPPLVVHAVSLGLLFTRSPGQARTLGFCGSSLMLLAAILETAVSRMPAWLMAREIGLFEQNMVIGIMRAMIGLLSAAGALLLVLALRFALPLRLPRLR